MHEDLSEHVAQSAETHASERRVAIETVYEQLAASLALAWPDPDIGAGQTIGPTEHRGWRVPTVGYLNFIHPPQAQIVGEPEIAYLAGLSPDLAAHVSEQLSTARTKLVILADNCQLDPGLHEALRRADIAVFTTAASGHRVAYRLRHFLGESLARQITLHGVFLEVL